jgi:hypothetical protein
MRLARRLRIEYEGAIYHVKVRGNAREKIVHVVTTRIGGGCSTTWDARLCARAGSCRLRAQQPSTLPA